MREACGPGHLKYLGNELPGTGTATKFPGPGRYGPFSLELESTGQRGLLALYWCHAWSKAQFNRDR